MEAETQRAMDEVDEEEALWELQETEGAHPVAETISSRRAHCPATCDAPAGGSSRDAVRVDEGDSPPGRVLIGHLLGLDYAGHRWDRRHHAVAAKIVEYDRYFIKIDAAPRRLTAARSSPRRPPRRPSCRTQRNHCARQHHHLVFDRSQTIRLIRRMGRIAAVSRERG